jgi:hypothetical protein
LINADLDWSGDSVPLRRLRREGDEVRLGEALDRDGVVSAMIMAPATLTFFLDVRDFSARRDLAVFANDATAGKSAETEKSHETHCFPPSNFEQFVCR